MTDAGLTRTVEGSVLHLRIDRPDRGNALDGPTTAALIAEFRQLATDPGSVRAVALGATGKHFCTGADLGGSGGGSDRPSIGHMIRSLAHGPHELIDTVWDCPVPVVAMVHGRASGMGLHLALACDFVIAADDAVFSEPFSQRGFNVDSGGSWLLPRLIGLHRAKQLLYFGEDIDAATASSWGLVGDVVPSDQLVASGRALVERLAAGPTFTLGVTKRLVHDHLRSGLSDALQGEARAVELTIRSRDFKEGMRAFMEKRPPQFSGE